MFLTVRVSWNTRIMALHSPWQAQSSLRPRVVSGCSINSLRTFFSPEATLFDEYVLSVGLFSFRFQRIFSLLRHSDLTTYTNRHRPILTAADRQYLYLSRVESSHLIVWLKHVCEHQPFRQLSFRKTTLICMINWHPITRQRRVRAE